MLLHASKMPPFARWILVVCGLAGFAMACNAILGVEEPIVDVFDGSVPLPEDGFSADAADVDDSADAGVKDAFVPPECEDASVIDDGPLYVLADGADSQSCGSQDVPCRTIAHAVSLARTIGKSVVRVGQGTYPEQIVLKGGITIEGGWIALAQGVGYRWYADCRGHPEVSSDVQIVAGDDVDVAVVAADLDGGAATLSKVTVRTKPQGATGQSLYGVRATGSSTNLTLSRVIVYAGNGGDGANGTTGGNGLPGSGDCPPGDGSTGAAGDAGSPPPAPTFDGEGFVPGTGGPGAQGQAGGNGLPGADGTCVNCCAGVGCGPARTLCGEKGGSGCGGGGGFGGGGGRGGGASVALFVRDARVTVIGGELHAGNGGKGGNGGNGGPGGIGATGSTGASSEACHTNCLVLCAGLASGEGGAGTVGGTGGPGGRGGGGAGGSSYAYVALDAAEVTLLEKPILAPGEAGAGGAPNGVAGESADVFTNP